MKKLAKIILRLLDSGKNTYSSATHKVTITRHKDGSALITAEIY